MLDGPLFESYRQEARRELLRRWTLRLLPVGAVLLVLSAGGLYHLATSSEEAPEPLLPVVPISQAVRPPEAGPEEPVEGPELPTRVLPSGGVLAVVDQPQEGLLHPHVTGELTRNDRLRDILLSQGIPKDETDRALAALGRVFDPRKLRPGQRYELWRSLDGHLDRFLLHASPVRTAEVVLEGGSYVSRELQIETRIEVARVLGNIETTVGAAIAAAGEKPRLAALVADFFGAEIDFHSQTRKGDQLRILVEKEMAEGRFVRYGRILAAEYRGGLGRLRAFSYLSPDGSSGIYDEHGQSLEGQFLRSPMPGHRVTSPFSPRRFHPVFKRYAPHRGVDYGGRIGDAVLAAADGTVAFAGEKGGNGLLLTINHPGGYQSLYAHLHRVLPGIKPGTKVKKGQVVAALGNSGVSTGPHLHYGITKSGAYLDPQKLKTPRGNPIPRSQMKDYLATIAPLSRDLDHMALSKDALLGDLLLAP